MRSPPHLSLPMKLTLGLILNLCIFLTGVGIAKTQSDTSVDVLVKQLSSRRFIDREQATLSLIDQGTNVIPLLLKQLEDQSLLKEIG